MQRGDEVGGAGRGSFNHRFGQASRDAEQHLNIFYPVDMFPFTDAAETDPETGQTGSTFSAGDGRPTAGKVVGPSLDAGYRREAQ